MKGLAESSPFHLLTYPHLINRFIFGHGVVIYYLTVRKICGVYVKYLKYPIIYSTHFLLYISVKKLS